MEQNTTFPSVPSVSRRRMAVCGRANTSLPAAAVPGGPAISAQHPGRLVTKAELRQQVGRHAYYRHGAVGVCGDIRAALGDPAAAPSMSRRSDSRGIGFSSRETAVYHPGCFRTHRGTPVKSPP
jgi:hypothetical protein